MAASGSMQYAVTPTIDEVVRECDAAWSLARKLRDSARDGKDEDVYLELVRAHGDLNKTYPAILAAMSAGSYNTKAVRKFFKYVKNHPWKTEAEFLEIQAIYHTMLFRALHPHTTQTAIKQMREQTQSALEENEKKTKEEVEKAKIEAEENNRRHARERVADLVTRVPSDATILTKDEVRPVIVAFDDSQ